MNSEYFKESDLMKVYAPPNLYSVEPGNRVTLRSGGPEMIVYDSSGVAPDGTANVSWLDGEGNRIFDTFPLVCLTCYPCTE